MGILRSSFFSTLFPFRIRLKIHTNHNPKDVDQVLLTACLVAGFTLLMYCTSLLTFQAQTTNQPNVLLMPTLS
jgi:hypothetical protein